MENQIVLPLEFNDVKRQRDESEVSYQISDNLQIYIFLKAELIGFN